MLTLVFASAMIVGQAIATPADYSVMPIIGVMDAVMIITILDGKTLFQLDFPMSRRGSIHPIGTESFRLCIREGMIDEHSPNLWT